MPGGLMKLAHKRSAPLAGARGPARERKSQHRVMLATLLAALMFSGCFAGVGGGEKLVNLPECIPGPAAVCIAADLRGMDFSGMDLSNADFSGAILEGAVFDGTILLNTSFANTRLAGSSFEGARLVETRFDGADVQDASFDKAQLLSVRFYESNLFGTTFSGAVASLVDMYGAKSASLVGAVECGTYVDLTEQSMGVCDPKQPYRPGTGTVSKDGRPGDVLGEIYTSVMPMISRSASSNPLFASKTYAYIAASAAAALEDDKYTAWLLSVEPNLPVPPSSYIPGIAAASAAVEVATAQMNMRRATNPAQVSINVTDIPVQLLYDARDVVIMKYTDADHDLVWNSVAWGVKIGSVVNAAAFSDPALTKPMISPDYKAPEQPKFAEWVPASPTFQPPLGPNWSSVRPVVASTADQESCAPPPPFGSSLIKNGDLLAAAAEVYKIGLDLDEEEAQIARFWDDGVGSSATPAGHWIHIARIASSGLNLDLETSVRMYADMSSAMFNASITTWAAKHRWSLVRPVTLIQRELDSSWTPYLVTPPHQEYPSGHAAISAAAAKILSEYLGNVPFTDPGLNIMLGQVGNFDLEPRSYNTFEEAATEAANSRILGGIHYKISATAGTEIGKCAAGLLLR